MGTPRFRYSRTRWPLDWSERAERQATWLDFCWVMEGIYEREGTHEEYQRVFDALTPDFTAATQIGFGGN